MYVRSCGLCQDSAHTPPASALPPERPWFRVHIYNAGTIKGKWILVIVDAHSKYIDEHIVSSPSSTETERMLRRTFATYGSPHDIVSDNASSFTSKDFFEFCAFNGIKHVRSAPYHPSSNGQAERTEQTVKSGPKKFQAFLKLDYCVS